MAVMDHCRVKLHEFFAASPRAVVVVSLLPVFAIEYANEAARVLLGYSELLKVSHATLFKDDNILVKMKKGGLHNVVCYHQQHGCFAANVSFSPFVDACVCIFEDAPCSQIGKGDTFIPSAYELLINSTPMLMGVLELLEDEKDTLLLSANQAMADLCGKDAKDIIGLWSTRDLGISLDVSLYKECMKTKQQVVWCEKRELANGDIRWLSYTMRYLGVGEQGRPRFAFMAEDVTPRKKYEEELALSKQLTEKLYLSEKKYRHLVESMPNILWTSKPDGTIDYWNRRMHNNRVDRNRDAERERETDRSYQSWAPILHPDDTQATVEKWNRAVETGTVFEVESRLLVTAVHSSSDDNGKEHDNGNGDGSSTAYRWHLMRAVPMVNEVGEIMQWTGVATDIHDRKALDELNEADLAKSRFLATMSHEMRTPLSCVISMASTMARTKLDSEQIEMLHTVQVCSEQLLILINNLLDIFKLEENRVNLEQKPSEFLKCLEESVDIVAMEARKKKIEIIFDIDKDIPPVITVDVYRLRQVLINLLCNAIKFTNEGGEVILRASLAKDRSPDMIVHGLHTICFSVCDNGIGIPKDGLEKLFQLFGQYDSSTTRRYGGSGLGLVISKKLVELFGGKIWFESEQGKGSTFHFTIVTKGVEAQPQLPASAAEADAAANPDHDVLVVLNHETLSQAVQKKVTGWGYRVTTFPSVNEACSWASQRRGSCTLLIDSEDSLAELHRQGEPPGNMHPIMFCYPTRHLDLSLMERVLLLRKPVKDSQLREAISRRSSLGLLSTSTSTSDPNSISLAPLPSLCDPQVVPFGERFPMSILVAEDNVFVQRVAVKTLKSLGYSNIGIAVNGKEVLSRFHAGEKFDVVLMDMEMPLMDGCEATSRIREEIARENWPHIIAMTANAFPEDRERCLKAGMCSYLSKPVRRELLESELQRAFMVRHRKEKCLCFGNRR